MGRPVDFEWNDDDVGSTHHGEPVARALLDTAPPFEPHRNQELIDACLRTFVTQ